MDASSVVAVKHLPLWHTDAVEGCPPHQNPLFIIDWLLDTDMQRGAQIDLNKPLHLQMAFGVVD